MMHFPILFPRVRSRAALAWAVAVVSTLPTVAAPAADWPQWQGPDRNSVSKEMGLLREWPKDGPPLAWKVTGLGGGYSAPAVAAGRIYGMSKRDGKEVVWALNEADGKELWATPIGLPARQGMSQGEEGPGCTPAVDGDRVYAIGNGGDLACLHVADGKVVWQKSMVRDFGGQPPMWAYRESPLVDGDKVVCTPGAADAMMVALNKLSGETIWKSKVPAPSGGGDAAGPGTLGRPGGAGGAGGPGGRGFGGRRGGFGGGGAGAAYASAIAINFEGQRQYVQLVARGLIGVSAADGKFLWRYDKPANGAGINCTSPLYHDGMVFASSAYGAGGGLVKLVKDGDGVKAEEVWFSKRLQNHHGGVVLFDGRLYGAHGGNEGGNIVCLDFKTGEQLWSEREERRAAKGSIALADGRLYYRVEDGTVLLIEPDAKQYVERGRFAQPDRSTAPDWSHPVVANGKLYLRDQGVLLCYDAKAKE
jgi:outer membrane protein assembly factor BamB